MGKAPTPNSSIVLQQLQGAATRVSMGDPADDARMIQWAREFRDAMRPFSDQAVYVTALEDALEAGERPVREVYGANYERLHVLKRIRSIEAI
jgi:hypothetical protein